MTQEELRKLQLCELDMLKEILKIIDKHNLRYFMLGGTMLGAVRHKGFIPWDDDIDLGMPRPDYEKFIEICKTELNQPLKLVYYKNQDKTDRFSYFVQIQNTDTKIIQHIAKEEYQTHVWIDIFPLDGMPGNPILRKIHATYLLYRRMRIQLSMFDDNVHLHRKNRPLLERFLIWFFRTTKIGFTSNPYEMMVKLERALLKCDYEKSAYLVNLMGVKKLKEMFPKKVYGSGKIYSFEDIELCGAEDADAFLTQMYGNYREPIQDVQEQAQHHGITIVKL